MAALASPWPTSGWSKPISSATPKLLTGLDLRATALTVRTAAIVRDAGLDGIDGRIQVLRTETATAGITTAQAALELAAAFHHAGHGGDAAHAAAQARLRDLARGGDYARYADLAHFMAGQHPATPTAVRWLDTEETGHTRWRSLVTARQTHLQIGG
ncbi:hypothetical protein AB0442_36295 [Kitasatospora sp. NPDC085895]|uniref:hypothetical protein n=1 Tax=Kitasatospora sp. NPDC085895 TaxID=3155057 RepID=UPI00344F2D28